MKHTYQLTGMTCSGCEASVTSKLMALPEVTGVEVSKDSQSATITMSNHISVERLQDAIGGAQSRYQIAPEGKAMPPRASSPTTHAISGPYYCPMHCEGDKTYERPGACPICGMDLVPMNVIADDEERGFKVLRKKFVIATVFTVPVFAIAMIGMTPNNRLMHLLPAIGWNWVQFLLSIPVFYVSWMFFERAYTSLVTRKLNMFTLIGLGTSVAFVFSVVALLFPNIFPAQLSSEMGTIHVYFEAATVILTLVLLGQLLEARAHHRTNNAIRELLKLVPPTANLIDNGFERLLSVDAVMTGDILRVKPGEHIPVDGRIRSGSATINESMITGEAMPVEKHEGDSVTAGTINGTTSFEMVAEHVGAETMISKIIKLVNDASRSRAPIQKTVDRVAGYFVPVVIAASIVTFLAWAIFGGESGISMGLTNAIAVLIIACPCALGLATPMSVMVGVGRGAKMGILIKNAESLEHLVKVDTLVVDKTGTITEGTPSVGEVVAHGRFAKDQVLNMIVALSLHSEHPLAKAIIKHAEGNFEIHGNVTNFKSVTGMGVTASIDEDSIAFGNLRLMEHESVSVPEDLLQTATTYQQQGSTVSFISIGKEIAGFVTLSDRIKPTSRAAIQTLQRNKIKVIMVTGDNTHTAKAVANELNIDFKAEYLPEAKLNEIAALQQQGRIVAMAGDGINDAPALAKANVGIAMGTGTDVAIESAAVTLVKGDLQGIARAVKLGKHVMKNIRQNLFFPFIYNIIGIPIAAGVLYPAFGLLLSPMIAGAAMSISSVSVILNALRLRNVTLND